MLAFIYFPLVIITLYAFNENITQSWPIEDWTTKWFSVAFHDEDVRSALWLSVKAAFLATLVALVLGTALAFAMARFSFFGQNALSFLVVLPIALPGSSPASPSTPPSTRSSSPSASASGSPRS